MVIETEIKQKEKIKVIHESVFWDESDPRWQLSKLSSRVAVDYGYSYQSIDMKHDSYIWAFTGTRGAGKSIAMTYYAAMAAYLWDMRIVSNYPIKFILKVGNKTKLIEAEMLDMYKLLCFDQDYKNCLIVIDESPDIISHMASMTWKNRLLNIFVRQLRKNMNSLFLGTQQLGLIDKSMRWQTDVVVRCKDAFRLYGASGGLDRGTCILLDFYDHSGQWTGHCINADWDSQLDMVSPTDSIELPGRIVWEAFDTYFQQDIFESLRKVDMKIDSYEVGNGERVDRSDCIMKALPVCEAIANDGKKVDTIEFFNLLGEMSDAEKQFIGKAMRQCGATNSRNGRVKDLTNFDVSKFREFAG
jgi:hypothetical protein